MCVFFNCIVGLLNIESVSSLNDWKMMAKKERLSVGTLKKNLICAREPVAWVISISSGPRQSQSYICGPGYDGLYIIYKMHQKSIYL